MDRGADLDWKREGQLDTGQKEGPHAHGSAFAGRQELPKRSIAFIVRLNAVVAIVEEGASLMNRA